MDVLTPSNYDGLLDTKTGVLNAVPAWGSYLYQNFLLPTLSPTTEWFEHSTTTPSGMGILNSSADYFGQGGHSQSQSWSALSADVKIEPQDDPPVQPSHQSSLTAQSYPSHRQQAQAQAQPQPQFQLRPKLGGPSSCLYPQAYKYNPSLPTSLLMSDPSPRPNISPSSIDMIDSEIFRSPSPLSSSHVTSPHHSASSRGIKRRMSSMDSDLDDEHEHDEHDHDVPEGVERDGMIWGMKVEEYRALSARERKRVRNRISARTFRAKRKEHLTSLESTLSAKDLQIKLAREESARLRREVSEFRRKLSRYEGA